MENSDDQQDPFEGGSSDSSFRPDCDTDSTCCSSDLEPQGQPIFITAEVQATEERNEEQLCVSQQETLNNNNASKSNTEDCLEEMSTEIIQNELQNYRTVTSNVRKKLRDSKTWKVNILKEKHQAGQEYINSKGKFIPAKHIKNQKDCFSSCKFKCGQKITESERLSTFTGFYKLQQNEKHLFLLNTTERTETIRPNKKLENSHKKYSFKYFCCVNNDRIQVCKKYFLGTLSISQKPIYNAHNNKGNGNIPKPDSRGKNCNRKISALRIQKVKDHINSFPRVESHYCRSSTKREYLEETLSLQKMYELYCEFCSSMSEPTPVKFSMYRYIFNTQFNMSFHKRKTDRCDLCEEYNVAKKQNCLSEQLIHKYEDHILSKNNMRQERTKDRVNKDIPVLCFDLQNVIALPRADVSSFFYKRKLNVYNLTAHLSTSKAIYCALWSECSNGRGGNELASAFKKILEKVAEEHDIKKLITWSDSCVPQNRNSFISTAVLNFMKENLQVEEIIMKYSTPGHSCIQEVDNAHSIIEKAMSKHELYSPIGVIRLLKSMNGRKQVRVIQMTSDDFRDYGSAAKNLNFKQIPFSSVCCLKFTQNVNQVFFKESFSNTLYRMANLRIVDRPKRKIIGTENVNLVAAAVYKKQGCISDEKKNDIMSMLKYMPLQDQMYYKTLLK